MMFIDSNDTLVIMNSEYKSIVKFEMMMKISH